MLRNSRRRSCFRLASVELLFMPQLLSPVGQSFQPVPTELKSELDQGTSFGDNFTSDTFHIRHFRPFLDHDIAFAHRVPRAASLDYWGKSSQNACKYSACVPFGLPSKQSVLGSSPSGRASFENHEAVF